ncbi:NRDE family protein [Halomicrobium salinisoli]|uniref:NRDE family protein n=1 Tax=Halomicrobium salinisoli TaxID=2878391 RepID=UPI001CF069ED|nr:NRDE family protein [Halomicrobium salinisoli]
MCTLVFAWQVFEPYLAAAANRDESDDRPSEPPAVREWDARALAPVDGEADGTWIGYNEHGVFVAITNRWTDSDLAGERSRGLLVRDVLGAETAEDAARRVERAVREDEYQGFNLVVADENAALYFEWDGQLSFRPLEPGVHVVVNVGADGDYRIPDFRQEPAEEQATNAGRVHEALQPEPGESAAEWLDRAAMVVADHDYGVCVHGDGFGTRSSSLLVLGDDERRYRFADGPPCETAYRPVEGQL